MAMNGKSLGKERLTLIHSRVKQIAERNNYNEKDGLKVERLCEFCEYQLNERQGFKWECHPSSKEFLIKCSGVTWVCESRSMIINFKHVPWDRATLMTKEEYNKILIKILRNNDPKDAMYIIEHFNINLLNEQQHMLKATQVAECIIYPHLIPFTLKKKAFPLPPPGREEDDRWVAPCEDEINGDEYYTSAQFSKVLMKNFGNDVMDPYCMQQFRNELDNISMKELLKK